MNITDTIAQWEIEVSRIDGRQPSEWVDLDLALNDSQYSYIRLGLLIEKIRNKCLWKYTGSKFESFKQWLSQRMQLSVWQANAYIQSAHIARYLANAGYDRIPRNFSQAIALLPAYEAEVGYYEDRPQLDRIWESACKLPAVTANAIKRLINPDAIEKESTKLPKHLRDRAAKQAAKKGMTIDEYLADLIGQDEYQDEIIDREPEIITEPDPELSKVIDRLERGWQPTLIDRSVDAFDNLMNNLVGNFIPRVQIE